MKRHPNRFVPLPEQEERIEIVDGRDRPLAVLSIEEAHRQSLNHRAVLVLVYDREDSVYLQKRSLAKSRYPGRWDLSATGHVQAGESREEAAVRELREELGLDAAVLKLWQEVPAGPENGFEFVTLFSAGRIAAKPSPNPHEVADGCFANPEELSFLVREFRETLTPALVYFWEKGLVFPNRVSL